ncbi:DUF2487 family protein [Piscibacillus halophilus]|uniref:DUF2487 domain-containing protein n=1 Tax=Piscibacillus halophilus TaxID=571933 RepID=A0A1H8ZTK4_9BACI|nr:DUF2487 family protein [Piscibacillus halophilus]SEP67789.1 Protein of unknown function [Piscibacillus halophilus]
MKYISSDIKQYTQAKEYIDTAILPLIPYTFKSDQDLLQLSVQKDLIQLYVSQIENELKGRVFVLPEYNYLKSDKIQEDEKGRLQNLLVHLEHQPFKYIFLITSDNKWRKITKDMEAELIWIPAMSDTDLNQQETQQLVQSQVKEIQSLIKDSWED